MSFNQAQQEAVSHNEGPCLVLAGPGSGKTLTIVGRIQKLIQTYHVSPEEILVITFTKYAAVRKIRLLEHIPQDSHFCLFWKLLKAVDILLFFSYIYSSLPAICSIHLNIIFPDKKCIDIRCFLIILIIQNSLSDLCRLFSNIDRRLRSGPGDH